jgi:hypothetical protein
MMSATWNDSLLYGMTVCAVFHIYICWNGLAQELLLWDGVLPVFEFHASL